MAAKALEFVIYTAGRTGEVLGATWAEIDLDGRLWTIPGKHMKANREHRVPLSEAALACARRRAAAGPATGWFPDAYSPARGGIRDVQHGLVDVAASPHNLQPRDHSHNDRGKERKRSGVPHGRR